jgi:Na+/H+-dicarboxylate symporter
VRPVGATVNMDGTALYQVVSAMVLLQGHGIDI